MMSMRTIAANTKRVGMISDARKHALEVIKHLVIKGDMDAADRELRAALALVAQLKSEKVPA